MSRKASLLFFAILPLAGCPTPPTALTTPTQQEGASGAGGSGGASASGGDAATAQTGQQQAQAVVLMDMSQTAGQKTQDEVKADAHVTVKGTLEGTCTGAIRVDVIEESAQPQPGQRGGPLTTADFAALGPFELFVPKGVTASLAALCDVDGDKKITAGTDGISAPVKLGETKADKSDVKLELAQIPAQTMQGGGQMGGGQMGGGMGGQMGGGQMGGGMGGPMGGGQMGGGMGGPMGGGQQGGQQGGGQQGSGQQGAGS